MLFLEIIFYSFFNFLFNFYRTCQACRANWCWLCNRQFEDATDHFSATNVFGCPGAQFRDYSNVCGSCRLCGMSMEYLLNRLYGWIVLAGLMFCYSLIFLAFLPFWPFFLLFLACQWCYSPESEIDIEESLGLFLNRLGIILMLLLFIPWIPCGLVVSVFVSLYVIVIKHEIPDMEVVWMSIYTPLYMCMFLFSDDD